MTKGSLNGSGELLLARAINTVVSKALENNQVLVEKVIGGLEKKIDSKIDNLRLEVALKKDVDVILDLVEKQISERA